MGFARAWAIPLESQVGPTWASPLLAQGEVPGASPVEIPVRAPPQALPIQCGPDLEIVVHSCPYKWAKPVRESTVLALAHTIPIVSWMNPAPRDPALDQSWLAIWVHYW